MATANLVKKINAILEADGERLHTSRTDSEITEFGLHYIRNFENPNIVATHVDIEALAVELGIVEANAGSHLTAV